MLAHLDTFIAFGAVMFGVSLFITAITQLVSGLLRLRGAGLVRGLELLVGHAAPQLKEQAAAVADAITRHPLISDSGVGKDGRATRNATAVRKEEVKNLMAEQHFWADAARHYVERVIKGQSTMLQALEKVSQEEWRKKWANAAGAGAFEELLDQVLDGAGPAKWRKEISASLKAFEAAERNAVKCVEGIELWFNTAMDRTSQRFATKMRYITIAASAVLALGLRLDSFALLKQLADDPAVRGQVSAQLDNLNRDYQSLSTSADAKLADRMKTLESTTTELKSMGIRLPMQPLGLPGRSEWPGILASMALLSLGAPFWFNLLRQAGNLRPIVANLEHKERQETSEDKDEAKKDVAKKDVAKA